MPRGRIKKITAKQRETFDEICRFTQLNGYPPTVKELGDHFGITPPSIVDRINQLIKKGYLLRDGRAARGIKILKDMEGVPRKLVRVPIVGTVAAGVPIMSEENVCGEVLVELSTCGKGEHFALEVSGESMICAGIHDGNLIIVKRQPLAETGDIVVAILNGEVTVKRLRINNVRIELIAENPGMKPIKVKSDDDLRILGKVVGCKQKA